VPSITYAEPLMKFFTEKFAFTFAQFDQSKCKCEQQKNNYDCGVFVLYYMQLLAETKDMTCLKELSHVLRDRPSERLRNAIQTALVDDKLIQVFE
jgi:Ulp1 family protease